MGEEYLTEVAFPLTHLALANAENLALAVADIFLLGRFQG
jgi:hypothetical protein